MRNKKIMRILLCAVLMMVIVSTFSVTAFAAGDVAGAIEQTWNTAKTQVQTVVNNVVFPVVDMILAILFFVKLGTAYFDYRKHGQFITCLPYEDPFEDCHVVVDCLLPSGKRIMLDPTWRLYLKDKEGNYVSLSHLRELLLADEPIFENQTADYNGTGFAKEYHRNYMIKNTFRFARCTLNKEGVDGRTETSRYIELIPQGYPIENFSEKKKADFVYNDIEFWQI